MKKRAELPYPTILVVDTSEREQIKLGLLRQKEPTEVITKTTRIIERRAQDLMLMIDEFLAGEKLELDQVKAIAILKHGPSLTGVRMGLATANTLGWLATLPLIEVAEDTFDEAIAKLEQGLLPYSVVKVSRPAA